MRGDRNATERLLGVLRPYASNWTGTLGRGDLVIPQREIPRLIHEILDAVQDEVTAKEAGDQELVGVLMAARRSASVQDQAEILRRHFRILLRQLPRYRRPRPMPRHPLRGAAALVGLGITRSEERRVGK